MNRDTLEGNWKQFTGKVKAQWGKLTGNQLEVMDGKRVEVTGKIQQVTASPGTRLSSRSSA